MDENEATDCLNFTLDEAGSLSKRSLFQKYNSVAPGSITFTNLYKFYTSSDSGYTILSGGNNLYKATSGSITAIGVSTNTVSPNSQWAFETFTDGTNDVVFAANQDTPLKLWDGSSATFYEKGPTPNTNCNILKKHKSRLWAAGSRTYPYRIYYSSLSNGADFTTTGG